MKKAFYLFALLSLYSHCADIEEVQKKFEKISIAKQSDIPTNIAAKLRMQQIHGPSTKIPIDLTQAYRTGDIDLASRAEISYGPPQMILLYKGKHKHIPYLSSANGLSEIPISIIRDHPSGHLLKRILIPVPKADYSEKEKVNFEQYQRINIQITTGEKNKISTIDLHNTNIHEIFPSHLSTFPKIKRIILPTSTPKILRHKNEKNNPKIKFVYKDEPSYGKPKSRFFNYPDPAE